MKKIKYIDVHSHLTFKDYDADRELCLRRAQEAGVAIISVGTDLVSSEGAIRLAEKNENMWAIVGVHPTETCIGKDDLKKLKELSKHPKVVGVGECGLDYFHAEPMDIPKQKDLFLRQIEIANSVNKPLMLHVRNAKDQNHAYIEVLNLLQEKAKVKANFHFFAGNEEDLKKIIEAGHYVSFTGVLTFARNYDSLVKNVPISRILSETDAPFVAPLPYRGKRNEPAYAVEVVKEIAKIRGEEEVIVAENLLDNARNLFSINFEYRSK